MDRRWECADPEPGSLQHLFRLQKVLFQVYGEGLHTESTGVWVHCKSTIKPKPTSGQNRITTLICSQPLLYSCHWSALLSHTAETASYRSKRYSFAVHCVRSPPGRERQWFRSHFLVSSGQRRGYLEQPLPGEFLKDLLSLTVFITCFTKPQPLTEGLDSRAPGQAFSL